MIDSFTSLNHRDFTARYKGTWGFFLCEDKTRLLVKVVNITTRNVEFQDAEGQQYYGLIDKGVQFDFIPVNKGFFNGDKETFFIRRHPARQWHRGIAEPNTNISCVRPGAFLDGIVEFSDVLPQVFKDGRNEGVYARMCFDAFVATNRVAVALSKHFALCGDACYFYQHQIGSITNHTITLNSPLVQQELKDAIRRIGFPLEVVNE